MRTNSKRIKFVVFDLGGVLIRIHPEKFYRRIFGKSLIPHSLIRTVQEELQKGKRGVYGVFKDLKKNYALKPAVKDLIRMFKNEYLGNRIGNMNRLIRKLKAAGFRLCILSNTNEAHISAIRASFKDFKDFHRLFFSHRLHCVKPGKEIFRRMLRGLKAGPEEVLYVDDTAENIRSAASLHIRCIKVKMNDPDAGAIGRFLSL